MALFGMLSLSGVQSVCVSRDTIGHIDIDAASFGIIECSKRVFSGLGIFTLFPSITLEFKILRSASESFIAHLRHDPLQHWTVLAMSASSTRQLSDCSQYIPSTCLYITSLSIVSSWQNHQENTWQLPVLKFVAFCSLQEMTFQLTQCDIQRMTLHL
jgi:hypothetical protein